MLNDRTKPLIGITNVASDIFRIESDIPRSSFPSTTAVLTDQSISPMGTADGERSLATTWQQLRFTVKPSPAWKNTTELRGSHDVGTKFNHPNIYCQKQARKKHDTLLYLPQVYLLPTILVKHKDACIPSKYPRQVYSCKGDSARACTTNRIGFGPPDTRLP